MLTFFGIDYNQLTTITLHFIVLSYDRFSRDDIIGEVIYPLTDVQLGDKMTTGTICREITPRHIKVLGLYIFDNNNDFHSFVHSFQTFLWRLFKSKGAPDYSFYTESELTSRSPTGNYE